MMKLFNSRGKLFFMLRVMYGNGAVMNKNNISLKCKVHDAIAYAPYVNYILLNKSTKTIPSAGCKECVPTLVIVVANPRNAGTSFKS